MPTIHLIRHGLTSANLEKRFAGRSNEPLHNDGIRQIKELAAKLKTKQISRIITGPLPRTRKTGEIIAKILELGVESNDGFNEIFLPHWDRLTKKEIRDRFGNEYPTWLDDPAGFSIAGCETIKNVQTRALHCMEKLFSDPDDQILVVTHLIVARALVLHYRNQPIDEFRSITINNGDLTTFQRKNDGITTVTMTI